MGEDDIRNHLNRHAIAPPAKTEGPRMRVRPSSPSASPRRGRRQEESFQDFSASHMFCPRCRQAMPVRQRIMLYLPDGDLYDYSCESCGTSTGTRKVQR